MDKFTAVTDAVGGSPRTERACGNHTAADLLHHATRRQGTRTLVGTGSTCRIYPSGKPRLYDALRLSRTQRGTRRYLRFGHLLGDPRRYLVLPGHRACRTL